MKSSRKILIVLGLLGAGALIVSLCVPVFSTTARRGTLVSLRGQASQLRMALVSYAEDAGHYPPSLETLVREGELDDANIFLYPAHCDLPGDRRDIPGDKWTLRWIYLRPKTDAEVNLPLLIAPLPFVSKKRPKGLLRIVVYATGAVQYIPEEEVGAIWNQVFAETPE